MDKSVDMHRVETVESARNLIAVSHIDVIICDPQHANTMRATGLPVVLRSEATSLERVRELASIEDPFTEIQRGIEEANRQSAAGRRALADVFALLGKTPRNRVSGGKA